MAFCAAKYTSLNVLKACYATIATIRIIPNTCKIHIQVVSHDCLHYASRFTKRHWKTTFILYTLDDVESLYNQGLSIRNDDKATDLDFIQHPFSHTHICHSNTIWVILLESSQICTKNRGHIYIYIADIHVFHVPINDIYSTNVLNSLQQKSPPCVVTKLWKLSGFVTKDWNYTFCPFQLSELTHWVFF